MIIKKERYVITTKDFPYEYEADNRLKFCTDERNEFYRIGDTVSDILEAYKWETEEDARHYMGNTIDTNGDLVYPPDKFEIRKVIFSCEIE